MKRFNLNHLIVVCFTIIVALGLIYVPNTFAAKITLLANEKVIVNEIVNEGLDQFGNNIIKYKKDNRLTKNIALCIFAIMCDVYTKVTTKAMLINPSLEFDQDYNSDMNEVNLLAVEGGAIRDRSASKKDTLRLMDMSLEIYEISMRQKNEYW
jgi:hypothetical protein